MFKIYDTETGENIGERAQNKATAREMAKREADERQRPVSYQEVGTKYAFVVKPAEAASR